MFVKSDGRYNPPNLVQIDTKNTQARQGWSIMYRGLVIILRNVSNGDATSASQSLQEGSTNPPWGWIKPSRRLREGFSVSSRSLQHPRRLHEALVKTSRTLCDGATASP